jgi:hypothetical protein
VQLHALLRTLSIQPADETALRRFEWPGREFVSKRVRRDTGREYRSGYHSAVRRQKVRAGSGVVERWRQPGVAVSASCCLLLLPPVQHSSDAALSTNLVLL